MSTNVYHPETDREEHDRVSKTKKVLVYGWDSSTLGAVKLALDGQGGFAGGDVALRLDDTTTANVTYVGQAQIGTTTSSASWKIKRIDESSGLSITWADGNNNYDNIWDNRASLSYL